MSSAAYQIAAENLRQNNEQWAAYQSTGHCVVLAGPGSGKTKTLTIKLARMLVEDVRAPRGIACITYTRACAAELERQLDKLGVSDSSRTFVGTVHSFCLNQIVVPFAKLAGIPIQDPVAVATANEQKRIFEESLKRIRGDENPANFRTRFNTYRRTCFGRHLPDFEANDEDAAAVAEEYDRQLSAAGLTDFDQMVEIGLRLIDDHEWVRKALKGRFPILVVDEYQDMPPALDRLVRTLCFGSGVRLFAVGDPDQSIYGFNDASPDLLRQLSLRDDVETIELKLNYRSGQHIISAAERALGEVRNYRSSSEEPGVIVIHKLTGGVEDQARAIIETIIPEALIRTPGLDLGDVAVLYRNQYVAEPFAKAAEAAGWKFIRQDNGNPIPRSPLIDWIQDCASWCSDGWRTGQPRLSALLNAWVNFHRRSDPDLDLRVLRSEVVRFLHSHRTPDTSAFEWLTSFHNACVKTYLERATDARDEPSNISKLLEIFGPEGQLAAFTVKALAGQGGAKDHLNLMTLHTAKGLEFPIVIMPALEEGQFPDFRAVQFADRGFDKQLREERRLFYVGLTRAKREIHLLWSGWYKTKNGRRGSQPSRYLAEVAAAMNQSL